MAVGGFSSVCYTNIDMENLEFSKMMNSNYPKDKLDHMAMFWDMILKLMSNILVCFVLRCQLN